MGSTSTVLLSLARGLTIGLVAYGLMLQLLSLVGINDYTYTIPILVTIVFYYFIPEKWGNYFSSPMNPWFEILLPFALMFGLYSFMSPDLEFKRMIYFGALGWLSFVLWALFGGGEFDLSARKNTFGF